MLILTRRVNEAVSLYVKNVKLGEVSVVDIDKSQIKIAFDLDKQIILKRNEIIPIEKKR